MMFGTQPVRDCVGAILAHALRLPTGPGYKKGAHLSASDVDRIAAAGHVELVVARLEPGELGEDEAASQIAAGMCGAGVRAGAASTGRANLFATAAGVLALDVAAVKATNAVSETITLATLPDGAVVEADQLVATLKIIPFGVPSRAVAAAARAAAHAVSAAPFRLRRVALILTRLPHTAELLLDKSADAQRTRVRAFGAELVAEYRCDHALAEVTAAIDRALAAGADLVLLQGASAIVDRRDVVPAAIERANGRIVHFGMPVDPGNLILIGRRDHVDFVGVPGCARSLKPSGFDMVLARLAAGLPVQSDTLASWGVGGLLGEIHTRPSPRSPVTNASGGIGAVLLAAGSSRRMGQRNKLLVSVDGEPLVRRAAAALIASALTPIVVVTGHERDAVLDALDGLAVEPVHNPSHATGMASSLGAGIAAVAGRCSAAVVALADMPWVRASHIQALCAAYAPSTDRLICVPVRSGKRGNPVLWSAQFFPEMQTLRGDVGARALLTTHADVVAEVEIDDPAVHLDIDTADDLTGDGVNLSTFVP